MRKFSWLLQIALKDSYPILCKYLIKFQNKYRYDVINLDTIKKYCKDIQLSSLQILTIINDYEKNRKLIVNNRNTKISFSELSRNYLYDFISEYCDINVE